MDSQLIMWVSGFILAIFGTGFSVYQFSSKRSREQYRQDLESIREGADAKVKAAESYAQMVEKKAEREIARLEKEASMLDADIKGLRKEVYKEFVSKTELKGHTDTINQNFSEMFRRMNALTNGVGEVRGMLAGKSMQPAAIGTLESE